MLPGAICIREVDYHISPVTTLVMTRSLNPRTPSLSPPRPLIFLHLQPPPYIQDFFTYLQSLSPGFFNSLLLLYALYAFILSSFLVSWFSSPLHSFCTWWTTSLSYLFIHSSSVIFRHLPSLVSNSYQGFLHVPSFLVYPSVFFFHTLNAGFLQLRCFLTFFLHIHPCLLHQLC